jgi:two-component system, OmpR family, sensor kinase
MRSVADGESGSAPSSSRRLLSLRLRLTLWVVLIASLVQFTVSLVALLYQASSVRSLYDDQLKMRADAMVESLPLNPADIGADRLRLLAERSSLQVFFDQVRIAIFDLNARPVAFDPDNPPPDEPEAVRRAIDTGDGAYADWTVEATNGSDGRPVPHRSYAVPIVAGDTAPPGLVLWISTSDRYAQQRIESVWLAVALTAFAGMLGSTIAGWYIAGIAVRPLDQLRSDIASISAGHMSLQSSEGSEDPEITRLREELDRAMDRVEQGYAAYGRFIANVSHELKTPIAVSLTEAQVLLTDPNIGERAERFARSIAEEMTRLGALVESFLTLTRVREGKLNSSLKDYPINDLVMDSVEHCATFARQNGVSLNPILLDLDETIKVCTDLDLMRTAIDNLIRNAIRFTPVGERIDITTSYREEDQIAVISVRDYGPGIPPELIPNLFDRFSQAQSEARTSRGTGLGLEIAQGIAELHGGKISVTNLDIGCRFSVELPRTEEEEDCPADADLSGPRG